MSAITRWWWIRHAPVTSANGRIYGQMDMDCDTSDTPVYDGLAGLLPRDAVWVTSHLRRTTRTAEAILARRATRRRSYPHSRNWPSSRSATGRAGTATS